MNSSHRRSGRRSAAALVVGLSLAAGLTACGSDSAGDTATDPATSTAPSQESTSATPSESPSESSSESGTSDSGSGAQETIPATGSAGVTEATVISATEGGGSTSTLAVALDTDQAMSDFTAQFDGGFADTVATSARDASQQAAGSTVYGATAAIGCEAPASVAIEAGEAGFEVTPALPKNGVQCLAPVTYVVLFAAPDA